MMGTRRDRILGSATSSLSSEKVKSFACAVLVFHPGNVAEQVNLKVLLLREDMGCGTHQVVVRAYNWLHVQGVLLVAFWG